MKNDTLNFKQLKYVINGLSEACEEISLKVPKPLQSILKLLITTVLFVVIFVVVPILIAPFIGLSILFGKKKINPFDKLNSDLKTIWKSDSSEIALEKLRDIHTRLYANKGTLKFYTGFKIEPYGKFGWDEYAKVNWLLYNFELQHFNWDEAGKICDQFLDLYLQKKKPESPPEEWIVYKARIIEHQKGSLETEKYLMKFIDIKKKKSPIREYLIKLRDSKRMTV